MFAAVKYTLEKIPQNAVWHGVLHPESKWAFIDDQDARKKMRDVFKNYGKWEKKAKKLSESYHNSQYWYDKFNESLSLKKSEEKVFVI